MNTRLVIVAICIAVGIVGYAYYFGKLHFEIHEEATTDTAIRIPTSKPVNELPTATEPSEIQDEAVSSEHEDVSSQQSTNSIVDEAKRYTSGPYKGLTYEQAMQVYEWEVKRKELEDAQLETIDKQLAVSDAILANTDEEISLIFNIVKLLPDDILQQVKMEAEKQQPEVREFFDALDSHSGSMTLAEAQEADIKIKSVDEILFRSSDKLHQEYERISAELKAHYENYPQF